MKKAPLLRFYRRGKSRVAQGDNAAHIGVQRFGRWLLSPGGERRVTFGARFRVLHHGVDERVFGVFFFCWQPALSGLCLSPVPEPAEGSRSTNSSIRQKNSSSTLSPISHNAGMLGKTNSPVFACYPR